MVAAANETTSDQLAEIRAGRDRKLTIVLGASRPAWIVNEHISAIKLTCLFDVVYRYGARWTQRRYLYEADTDVLYFQGEFPFDETKLHTLPDSQLFKGTGI